MSYLLQQGDVRFLVTGGLGPGHVVDRPRPPPRRRHPRHRVPRRRRRPPSYEAAVARGATAFRPPADDVDATGNGTIRHAAIATYGETVHTFLDRSRYDGPFAPQFEASPLRDPVGPAVGIERIDHVVANVELGTLDQWVDYYEHVLGFDQLVHFCDEAISTEYSALMSTVVWNHDKIVLPINEPAEGRRKSQIEEYLDYYGSPGVQHIALRTADIVSSVRALRDRGVRFLDVPSTYYDEARDRMGTVADELPWERLAELGILVDRDPRGLPAADLHRDASPTGRPCSSRSSSAKAPRASAKATSRPSSKPSNANKSAAATCSRPGFARTPLLT